MSAHGGALARRCRRWPLGTGLHRRYLGRAPRRTGSDHERRSRPVRPARSGSLICSLGHGGTVRRLRGDVPVTAPSVRRWTADVDLLDDETRRQRRDRRGDAGRAHDAHGARPVGPDPGRDRRPLRPPTDDVLAGAQDPHGAAVLVGQAAGDGADLGVHLAAERATVGERRRRLAAGRAPGGVGLQVAGLDPGRLQRAAPSPRPARPPATSPAPSSAGPDAPGQATGRRQRLGDVPGPVVAADRDEGVGGRGVVGEAARPGRHRGADRLWRATLDRRPPRRAGAASSARIGPIGPDPTDRTASTIGCQPVQRQRWAASARCTAAGDVRAARRQGGDAQQDARRAEPALGGTGAGERGRTRRRRRGGRRAW